MDTQTDGHGYFDSAHRPDQEYRYSVSPPSMRDKLLDKIIKPFAKV